MSALSITITSGPGKKPGVSYAALQYTNPLGARLGILVDVIGSEDSARETVRQEFDRQRETLDTITKEEADETRPTFEKCVVQSRGVVGLQIADIARTCHEVNRAYCRAIGDYSQPAWEDAPDWQKQSAMAGVEATLRDPGMTPEKSHASWLAHKRADGWVWGPNKDEVQKTHPCMTRYEMLPEEQRTKDHLFLATVRALQSIGVSVG